VVRANRYGESRYFSKRGEEAEMVVGLGGVYGRRSELVVTFITICWYNAANWFVWSKNQSDL